MQLGRKIQTQRGLEVAGVEQCIRKSHVCARCQRDTSAFARTALPQCTTCIHPTPAVRPIGVSASAGGESRVRPSRSGAHRSPSPRARAPAAARVTRRQLERTAGEM